MDRIVEQAQAPHDPVAEQAQSPPLTAGQRELLASLERSFQQAARGQTRPAREFLEELRIEREVEDLTGPKDA